MISILTPTYNREKELLNLYRSLCEQKNKNFEWVVIDDGSLDDTYNVISDLKKNAPFNIKIFKKENGGKHKALNYGYEYCYYKYICLMDSDDTYSSDAIEIFINEWKIYDKDEEICAISALCQDERKRVIGKIFPDYKIIDDHINLTYNLNINGDKFESYRKDVLQKYKFPEIEGENFLTEAVVWNKIAEKYKKVCINEIVGTHIYLNDGLSKKLKYLHKKNPIGSMIFYKSIITLERSRLRKYRNISLYYYYRILAKNYKIEQSTHILFYIIAVLILIRNISV